MVSPDRSRFMPECCVRLAIWERVMEGRRGGRDLRGQGYEKVVEARKINEGGVREKKEE